MFKLTYICIFLDFFFYPYYYDIVGKHNLGDRDVAVSCMAQSCSSLKHSLYLQWQWQWQFQYINPHVTPKPLNAQCNKRNIFLPCHFGSSFIKFLSLSKTFGPFTEFASESGFSKAYNNKQNNVLPIPKFFAINVSTSYGTVCIHHEIYVLLSLRT